MKQRSIKDPRGEYELFRLRAVIGFLLIVLGLIALGGRYYYLQVMHHDEFVTRSDANRIKPRAVPPARGLIFDRDGVLLADNVPAFRLEVVPEQVPDIPQMLDEIRKVLPLDPDDIDAFKKQLKQHRRFDSVPLKFHLTEDEIAKFEISRWRFPGVDVVPYLTRRYLYGPLFAHVIGYVARLDADDLTRLDPVLYKGTTHVGRSGLERYYENKLHGTPGYELVEVNVDGRTQRVLETHAPKPGKNLYLAIDFRMQQAATEALQGQAGSAVAIDPRNGQVLTMISVPSFDPNLFVNGISRADYKALNEAEDRPLLNRAIKGVYPPGSTVKPLLGLGGLELGLRRPEDSVVSTGTFYIPGQSRGYRDDQRGGVGMSNLYKAIQMSVNTYFYRLALDMGIDRLSAWMGRFGFGKPTGIDLYGESSGVLPSREWKAKRSKLPWYPGETVIAGIGQGYWAVTPMQLAHALATFAEHGVAHTPRLLMATQDGVEQPRLPLVNPPSAPSIIGNPSHWEAVNKGMEMVISSGTGSKLGLGFPYSIAGKSGTAERFSRKDNTYDNRQNLAELAKKHRAWFMAYTPSQAPEIAVVSMMEHGAWGASAAGPIARKMLDVWLVDQGKSATPLPESVVETARGVPSATNSTENDTENDEDSDQDQPASSTSVNAEQNPAAASSSADN